MTDLSLAPPPAADAFPGLDFALERPEDADPAAALIGHAFGPGRFAKTAERLREGNRLRRDLSVCAWNGTGLAGVVHLWPILIGDTSAVFLGPFAVADSWRDRGLGRSLIGRGVRLAQAAGERLVLLVGPRPYFGPLGFEPVPKGRLAMPGPVDPARLLWRPLAGGLDGVGGPVRVPPPPRT